MPFGEYIPFADTLPWLHRLTPFPADFGISAGNSATVFPARRVALAPLICFEDTVPHLVRGVVAGARQQKRAPDVLVNLTNDGWFHGSSELDQHLVTAVFPIGRMPHADGPGGEHGNLGDHRWRRVIRTPGNLHRR
ncbi:MAG: hypothetical protein Ct9H300mP1_05800 [Planctomycetaceae bacterium]|nr:MAG: hypothetical protein Ct9H300mP1_05800 [Planctomycetaceae bacterium]